MTRKGSVPSEGQIQRAILDWLIVRSVEDEQEALR